MQLLHGFEPVVAIPLDGVDTVASPALRGAAGGDGPMSPAAAGHSGSAAAGASGGLAALAGSETPFSPGGVVFHFGEERGAAPGLQTIKRELKHVSDEGADSPAPALAAAATAQARTSAQTQAQAAGAGGGVAAAGGAKPRAGLGEPKG